MTQGSPSMQFFDDLQGTRWLVTLLQSPVRLCWLSLDDKRTFAPAAFINLQQSKVLEHAYQQSKWHSPLQSAKSFAIPCRPGQLQKEVASSLASAHSTNHNVSMDSISIHYRLCCLKFCEVSLKMSARRKTGFTQHK